MSLIERLKDIRIRVSDLVINDAPLSVDQAVLRCFVSEKLAREMLKKCNAQEIFDYSDCVLDGFYLQRGRKGIEVIDDSHHIICHEYDGLFMDESNVFFSEVKSTSLHGFTYKIPRALQFADMFFSDSEFLIFYPCNGSSKSYCAHEIEKEYPKISVIDLGYKQKDFAVVVNDIYWTNKRILKKQRN
ncbi:hypothetical protein JXM83_00340 [Candidatus Woesearchaeota archaeon]|nr:hypothetical protein [Candidatus Woesearchaeota archaeon]